MSREGWIAAGVFAVLGVLALRGRSRSSAPTAPGGDPKLGELTADAQAPVAELLSYIRGRGFTVAIGSARRTCAEQRQLFAIGRTAPGEIITGADGCRSWHVLGRAVDLRANATDADWRAFGAWWQSRGGVWGGNFPNLYDPAHFEWHPGLSIEQLCPDPARCEEYVA